MFDHGLPLPGVVLARLVPTRTSHLRRIWVASSPTPTGIRHRSSPRATRGWPRTCPRSPARRSRTTTTGSATSSWLPPRRDAWRRSWTAGSGYARRPLSTSATSWRRGRPTCAELAAQYAEGAGRYLSTVDWCTTLALRKLAVLYEYGRHRGCRGRRPASTHRAQPREHREIRAGTRKAPGRFPWCSLAMPKGTARAREHHLQTLSASTASKAAVTWPTTSGPAHGRRSVRSGRTRSSP
jgi:hypothetical protein